MREPKLTVDIKFTPALLTDIVFRRHFVGLCECGTLIKTEIKNLEIISEGPYGQPLWGCKCKCGRHVPFRIPDSDAYFISGNIKLTKGFYDPSEAQ